MKTPILLITLSLLLFFSCKKNYKFANKNLTITPSADTLSISQNAINTILSKSYIVRTTGESKSYNQGNWVLDTRDYSEGLQFVDTNQSDYEFDLEKEGQNYYHELF